MPRAYTFVIYRDRQKQCRWTLYAPNGRKIATCGEGYRKRSHAVRMITRIIGLCLKPGAVAIADKGKKP